MRSFAARVRRLVRMAIEVIGRKIQQRRNPRPEGVGGFELEAARLDHVHGVGGRRLDLRADADSPMLPPTSTRLPDASSMRPTSVVVVDLPLVPVIATIGPRSQRDASSSSPITGTPARPRAGNLRQIDRHARAQHHQIGRFERRRHVPAELEATPGSPQFRFFRNLRLAIGQRDVRAAARQQMRGGHTAPRGAHHQHLLPAHGEVRCRHRSFNVVRLNSANMIATIRKRVMTFGSSQPLNSKW